MIVISGALVLVALVLLVLGLTMTDLDFVYGSIGVSLVSFVFLVIGILQRRGEQPAPAGAAPEVTEGRAAPKVSDDAARRPEAVPTPVPAAPARRTARVPAPVVVEDDDDEEEWEEGGGTVLIVPGRPRYHLEGCRYLSGKGAEPIDVLDAREDGFTPCGVCKPDSTLAALAAEDDELDDDEPYDDAEPDDDAEPRDEVQPHGEDELDDDQLADDELDDDQLADDELDDDELDDDELDDDDAPYDDEDGVDEPEPLEDEPAARGDGPGVVPVAGTGVPGTADEGDAVEPAPARPRRAPRPRRGSTALTAPATDAPASEAPDESGERAEPLVPIAEPVPVVPPSPRARAAAATPEPAAAATPEPADRDGGTTVIIIPDRGRFHTPACRFVRGVLATEEISRAEAAEQGFKPCGVCKP